MHQAPAGESKIKAHDDTLVSFLYSDQLLPLKEKNQSEFY